MSQDNTEFTGTHVVILPADAFDPDAVFYDELDVNAKRMRPDLDVPGIEDESLLDRAARSLDNRGAECESDNCFAIERDFTIDGLESSMFGRIKNYFNGLKR